MSRDESLIYHFYSDMASLKDIFAHNLKKKRGECSLSQAKLAEKVNVSTHHIAMIETAKEYPAMELVERIAAVLNIEIYELFMDPLSPPEEMQRLFQLVSKNIEQVVSEAVEKVVTKQYVSAQKDQSQNP